MKIDKVSDLLYAFIRNDKKKIALGFESCIANEREGAVKNRLRQAYDEYKRREGYAVVQQLEPAIQMLVSAPYRECTFDDLFLTESIKACTDRFLLEWANKDYLIENGLVPMNKILLEGPPGNGKTSFTIALAKRLNLPLINTNSSLMLDSYLGKSEKNVALLFKNIPENCVLLFDEFEAMASARGRIGEDSGGAGRAWNSIVTSFLVNMETIRPSILFIAATNRIDMLDKAVLRRFDMTIRFDNPNNRNKNSYIEKYLKTYNLNHDDFLIESGNIAQALSYSDMERVMRLRHKEIILKNLINGGEKK